MKTEVYSWRLAGDVKSNLERAARRRNTPVSSVLEEAVRDWLKRNQADAGEDQAQRALHAAAGRCLGTIAGNNPGRAAASREAIRKRLRLRYAR